MSHEKDTTTGKALAFTVDTPPWHGLVQNVQEGMKSEIVNDVKAGIVPLTVGSFSELHKYVDANCYGGFPYNITGTITRSVLTFDTDEPATK